ncbi:hypothetical protein [Microbacterium phyllosphaerae]|uniref:glycoside hydrolase family 38 N-terminal domain-containing protein n=1 Tax=Microbacterium phyllosphaerae TaxID=124798 RepID=UPI003D65C29C
MNAATTEPKRILIYFDEPNPTWGYLPWLLHDPLLLAERMILTETRVASADGGRFEPDLSAAVVRSFDLVIVPFPHTIRDEFVGDLLSYLDTGGALFLVQPSTATGELPRAIADRADIRDEGWVAELPYHSFSLTAEHPGARVLGVPEGTSAYPHAKHARHPRYSADGAAVLTRIGGGGDPDLVVSSSSRIMLAATDVFADLQAHEKETLDYYRYRRAIGYLMLNGIRELLGYGFVVQPIQKPQQRWSDMFSAYAAGKAHVMSVRDVFPERLSPEEALTRLHDADSLIERSVRSLTGGRLDEGREHYDAAIRILSECMAAMTQVDRFLIRGWQANALFDHDYGGGLLGFAQTQWMDLLLEWMTMQLDWITRSGAKRVHAIASMTWEIMAKYYPEEVRQFARATDEGRLEAVSGLYTQAYLPLLSAESNVRQFALGHRALRSILDADVEVFLEPRDHFNFHPQLPQILKGFGFEYAILRCLGHLGELSPVLAHRIRWRGLDGTEIEAVPTYEGIPSPHLPQFWLDAELLGKADALGYPSLLLGDSFDSTLDFPGEKEHTFLNAVAPVAGTWVTASEYFEHTTPAEQSIYFGVDDLYARLMEVWSSFGCLNEAYGWNRDVEARILSAEKFGAVASLLSDRAKERSRGDQQSLEGAWKQLLATQDRMALGAPNYDEQTPPFPLEPGGERAAKHYWGFHLGLLPEREKFNTMGMENLQEMLTENYAGPMVPVSRYQKVVEAIESSRSSADRVLGDALSSLACRIGPPKDDGLVPVVVYNQLGWRKRDIITLEREFPAGRIRSFIVLDGEIEVTHQVLSQQTHPDGSIKTVNFLLMADIPSMGYKTYFLKPVEERI